MWRTMLHKKVNLQELDNITEEFNTMFDEDEVEKGNKNVVSIEKYEQLRVKIFITYLIKFKTILTIHLVYNIIN